MIFCSLWSVLGVEWLEKMTVAVWCRAAWVCGGAGFVTPDAEAIRLRLSLLADTSSVAVAIRYLLAPALVRLVVASDSSGTLRVVAGCAEVTFVDACRIHGRVAFVDEFGAPPAPLRLACLFYVGLVMEAHDGGMVMRFQFESSSTLTRWS